MTTELEEQFFKVFGIEPKVKCDEIKTANICICLACPHYKNIDGETGECQNLKYPEITDRKLLQLLCIYNDMQGCVEMCIAPCKYEDTKEMILKILIDEKTSMTDYEEGTYMDVMTKQIQQLFKEEE